MSYPFAVWSGLVDDPKHREAMGKAVWLYLWLLARITVEEKRIGEVLGGKSLTTKEIGKRTGLSDRSVRRQLSTLTKLSYLKTYKTPTGIKIFVNNSKKFDWRAVKSGRTVQTPSPKVDGCIYDKKDKKDNKDIKRGFRPPTPEEVTIYCKERKNNVDPNRFIDFYSAKGWFIGRNKMKDWRAAVRTWEQKNKQPKTNFKRPALIVASELKANQYSKDEVLAEMSGKYTEREVGMALEKLF